MRSYVNRLALVVTCATGTLLSCGARTGLLPGRVEPEASAGAGGEPVVPQCSTAMDCPQPPPGQCGNAACTDGVCSLDLGMMCDDKDPCTVDSCTKTGCKFEDGRVDADEDGAFASGTLADPKAALGCGKDCDDTSAEIFPGAIELCDGLDNDCNKIVDDGTSLMTWGKPAVQVSPPNASHAGGAGLAFDGQGFGVTMTSWFSRSQGQFQALDAQGQLLGGPQRIARVNAEAYGGPLVWTGERYLTAYQDARQDGNYEIYFNLLNKQGQRLNEDLRVTNADDYSLRPSVLWTGAEALLIWDDRRFEQNGDASALFGQRVSFDGQLLGANERLSAPGVRAENAAPALADDGVGIAYLSVDQAGRASLEFMTTSRKLSKAGAPTRIDFDDPDGPVTTVVGDQYVVTFHQDDGINIGASIFGVVLDKSGKVLRVPQSITAGAAHARGNATYSYGDRFVMVWGDDRSGTYQLYAQTFDKKLAPISPMLRITTSSGIALDPVIAPASDGGLGILYSDKSSGQFQAFFTRLDCQAAFERN